MKLSIVITFFNADNFIGRMLTSLLKQDLCKDEYEIIIIDDGSSEEPLHLMKFVNENSNIFYHRQDNTGPGGARNTGLSFAKGDYVMFCDSDDYVAENILGKLCNIATERKLDMLFYNVPRVTEKEALPIQSNDCYHVKEFSTGKDYFAQPIVGTITTGVWQFIIKRSLICNHKLAFPSDMIMNEDSCFFIDAILAAGKTGKIEADVYFYVQNPESLIHSLSKKKYPEKFANNMLLFVKKLTEIIEGETKNMPKGFIENIRWLRNQKSYILLFRSCRTLNPLKFEECVKELNNCNSYPHPYGRKKFSQKMFLWPPILRLINKASNVLR